MGWKGEDGLLGRAVSGVGILGSGRAFPDELGRWVENEEIHEMLYGPSYRQVMREKGKDPAYPFTAYGFQRRFWVHTPGDELSAREATSADLMERAARVALQDAALSADQIDLFIAVTTTSPRYTSSLATVVGGRLGYKGAAFEMKSGCSSSLYALSLAYRFLDGGAHRVLIASGETLSKVTAADSAHLYAAGDGGGAVILGRVEQEGRGLLVSLLSSDGSYSDSMGVPGILPPVREELERGAYFLSLKSDSSDIIRQKWKELPGLLRRAAGFEGDPPEGADGFHSATARDAGRSGKDPIRLVCHQVNRPLLRLFAEGAGEREEQLVDLLPLYGNFGSASLLVALDRLRKEEGATPGTLCMLGAVGGGLAWAGAILRL